MVRRAGVPCFFVCVLCASVSVDVLRAQSGLVVAGAVRADGSGQPLPGARVVLTRQGDARGQRVSDAEGRFEIPLADRGAVDLVVTKAGYAPTRLSAPAGAPPLDVRLIPGAVLTGRVIDGQGLPLPNVMVRLRRIAAGGTPGAWITVTTDDQGEYRAGSLPAGRYDVAVVDIGAAGAVGGAGANMALLLASLPETGAALGAGTPHVTLELQAGRTTTYDHERPQNPALATQTEVAMRTLQQTSNDLRKALGGQPVDPTTAGQLAGVVTGPDARPIQALVRVVPEDGGPPFITLSDAAGRYAFDAVPPGTYRVIARGGNALDTPYGATARAPAGTSVRVRERQRTDQIDVVLPRAAVIAGRATDTYGEPLEGLRVAALLMRAYGGRSVLQPVTDASTATTDDRGQYRLHGLSPGRYVLVMSDPEPPLAPLTSGDMQDTIRRAMSLSLSPLSTPSRPHAYYPGRPTAQEASPIQVDVGLDALGVDMVFAPAAGVGVAGVVFGPDGAPMRAYLTLSVSRRSGAPLPPAYRASAGADGTFSFPSVVPGEYVLQAEQDGSGIGSMLATALGATRALGDGVSGVSVTGGGATTDVLSSLGGAAWTAESAPAFATTFVQVADREVVAIALHATKGSTLSGRLTFEGPTAPPTPAAFAVGFASGDTDLARANTPSARSTRDGTVAAFGLVGPLRMFAAGTPPGWWLKSATIDGVNAVEQPVSFADGSRSTVDVVFSSAPSGISGRLVDRGGKPVAGAVVLAFPSDETGWHAGTRYVRQVPVKDGQFELLALPPGQYVVAAVDAATAATVADWQEPDVLNRLIPLAQQVTVREGRIATVRPTVIALP